jgi:hypothetical protein
MQVPILDQYRLEAPSPQALVDLFKGEWSSALPPVGHTTLLSGQAGLFDDARIRLLNEKYPLYGRHVLELGPLEAGHTYMMHQLGARHITAVEANARAYLKCLLVKELYQLNRTSFLHGEVMAYLAETEQRFELCVASGILYHMSDPAGFLERCAAVADRLFIWTHYAIPETFAQHPVLKDKITGSEPAGFRGYDYTLYHYAYQDALGWEGFCGGTAPTCRWITREAITAILERCGYNTVHVLFDEPEQHPNGPHLCLLAEKG